MPRNRLKRNLLSTICILCASAMQANTLPADTAAVDSVAPKQGFISRVINYFSEANKSYPTEHIDFSFLGGPHYSSDSKFGIGLLAAGLYSTNPEDTLLQPSNVSLFADLTTAAHFKVGIRGEHIAPQDLYRLDYEIDFESIETKFWGIGYSQCSNDDNESKFRYLASSANVKLTRQIVNNIYVGPMLTFNYINARRVNNPVLWEGLDRRTFSWGFGVTFRYDTRDNSTETEKGVLAEIAQTFDSRWMGNCHGFSVNEITAAWYGKLWRGAVLATRLHSRVTWGDTPWGMMSYIGGSYNMRGYFEGRYRDKSEIDLCVELRQHVWRRNGIVVWGGAATIFPRFKDINLHQILPNWGVGYRWEFKQRMNVRVDLGFGKGQCGFIFNINEAF